MPKNKKSANWDEPQNRKTGVFWPKNRSKIAKTAKPENPNAPLNKELNTE